MSIQPKAKLSQREAWLIALLPAALVAIASFAIPGPADRLEQAEQQLERIGSEEAISKAHFKMRSLTEQYKRESEKLDGLKQEAGELAEAIRVLKQPAQRVEAFDMAGALDALTRRLSGHGAYVLSMEAQARQSASSSRAARRRNVSSSAQSQDKPKQWVVSVAATWPVLQSALGDAGTLPPGLALSAMNMEPAVSNGSLHRWELVVAAAEHSP